MTFIVDGRDWEFNGLSREQICSEIESALEFVANSTERDQRVLIGDDFQTRRMLNDLSLWDLFGPSSPIELPGEILQELAAWLGTNPLYSSEDNWPEEFNDEIQIGDDSLVLNADVAWAHHHTRARRATACFSLRRTGPILTKTANGTSTVHFLKNEKQRSAFWRDAILLEGDTAQSLMKFSGRAYPNLYFHDSVISSVTQLRGGYEASRNLVRESLATLDDHSNWIFTRPPPTLGINDAYDTASDEQPTNQIIIDRFRGVGLNVAPENPNVRRDRICREAREITVEGEKLYCHWHVKLELHRNRIHIHAPVRETFSRTVIAIIHEHLPLP